MDPKHDEGTNDKAMAAGAAAGADPGTPPAKGENMVPQARVDAIAAQKRQAEEAKQKAESERDALLKEKREREEAEAKAADQKLAEDGKLKELVETKEKAIAKQATELSAVKADLEQKAALASDLSTFVNETIDAEIKDWPDEVKALVPGADDVKARAAEVKKLRPLAAKLSTRQAAPGNGTPPKPARPATDADADKQARQSQSSALGSW